MTVQAVQICVQGVGDTKVGYEVWKGPQIGQEQGLNQAAEQPGMTSGAKDVLIV